ncbi:MAG: CBS domain-containing protein [Caldilineaceae bacterium]|nr:CBS domain-containing protein [Caldilineaceae bacterium]
MIVQNTMTSPVITLFPDTPFPEALKVMKEHRIRRIPIVNKQNKLVGIISERDLLQASPSSATSLNIWEMNYLLAKLAVRDVMTRSVVTVTPHTLLQDAASLMLKHKVGGLPVISTEQEVVGVITETDIFREFVNLLNADQSARLDTNGYREKSLLTIESQ